MNSNQRYYSPLRYPGGKAKLAKVMGQILSANGLCDCSYIEPYAGGAGVALELLFHEIASTIHINDIDSDIYNFWNSVLNETNSFLDLLFSTPVTIEEWHNQRAILHSNIVLDPLRRGFAAFFLNRTNRSGIIDGGAIGGTRQNGKWKIDARYNRHNLSLRIKKISYYKSRIFVYNKDAVDLMNEFNKSSKNYFLYADPPYVTNGKRLYRNYYNTSDHVQIAETLSKLQFPWVATYDNHDLIKDLYSSKLQHNYTINYSAGISKKGTELFISSDSIHIPAGCML